MTREVHQADPRPSLRSSRQWDDYFARNDQELMAIPWETGGELTDQERKAITSSIQGFQLGESSEGFHLSKCAKVWSERHADPDYYEAIKRFIREEQRHARDLGRFMEMSGIPKVRKTWPDTVFRKLRHCANLELSIAVLVTAEIIAKVYYPALQQATASPVLRKLCDQIIQDEKPHVEFQCERLAILRQHRSRFTVVSRQALHRFFLFGTSLVVWHKHGRAMRAGGLGFRSFLRECRHEFELARQLMDPAEYSTEGAALTRLEKA